MGVTWTNTEVVHLLLRAGFGGAEDKVKACVALGREEMVRRLIAGEALTETAALTPFNQLNADGKKVLDPLQLGDQQMYWLYRMVNSSAPLIEKMTLFWHGSRHGSTDVCDWRESKRWSLWCLSESK